MKYDPNKYHRRSIRLKRYDYSRAGAYFVTICTRGRECVLTNPVVAGIIGDVWTALPEWFPTIALDEFVVMPNHVHLVVWLQWGEGAGASPAPTLAADDVGATLAVAPEAIVPSDRVIPPPDAVNLKPILGNVVGSFKSLVFTVYYDWVQEHDPNRRAKFWQRNYYEHTVRDERELSAIRRYIRDNPLQWKLDRDNPQNLRRLPPPVTVDDYLEDILALPQE